MIDPIFAPPPPLCQCSNCRIRRALGIDGRRPVQRAEAEEVTAALVYSLSEFMAHMDEAEVRITLGALLATRAAWMSDPRVAVQILEPMGHA